MSLSFQACANAAVEEAMMPLCGACNMLAKFCAIEKTPAATRPSFKTEAIKMESKTDDMENNNTPPNT
jgi:hypothetical protein